MQATDIDQVTAIEQAAYGANFSERDYQHDLEQNALAHYFVVRPMPSISNELPVKIIGVAGFWLITDELHIITIAVRPRWQGVGLGEWILLTLIEKGQTLGAKVATLEVRPSNKVALSLYQKYGFREAGRRMAYYSNNEDALILTTPLLSFPDYQARLNRQKYRLKQKLAAIEWEAAH